MRAIVFDSSVLIALLKREAGWQEGEKYLSRAVVSAINLAEVATYFARLGASDEVIEGTLASIKVPVVPFDGALVPLTAALQREYQSLRLSLGDRACLATAMQQKLPILTADRTWAKVDGSLEIRMLR